MDRMTQSQIFISQLCSISKVNDEFCITQEVRTLSKLTKF